MEEFLVGHHITEVPETFVEAVESKFGSSYDSFQNSRITLYGSDIDSFASSVVAFNGYLLDVDDPAEHIARLYRNHGPRFPVLLEGQYRLVLYDREKDRLLLVSDRIGTQTLYAHRRSQGVVFSSHLTPLLPVVDQSVDRTALSRFLVSPVSTGFSGERTLLRGVRNIGASRIVIHQDGACKQQSYWDLEVGTLRVPESVAINKLSELLLTSAEKHYRAIGDDAAVAVSGSSESNFLAALMTDVSESPVKTVSFGFEDAHFGPGRQVSELLDTNHEEFHYGYNLLSPKEMWEYELPSPALPAFPFRSVTRCMNPETIYTGMRALLPFPYLPRLVKLSRFRSLAPLLRLIDRVAGEQVVQLLGKGSAKGFDILASPYTSAMIVNHRTIRQPEVTKISVFDGRKRGRKLESAIDQQRRLADRDMYDAFLYLQLKEFLPTLAVPFSTHADVFMYTPLVEYAFKLPVGQKKETALLQKIMKQRYPEMAELSYTGNFNRVIDILKQAMMANRDTFSRGMDRLGERSFMKSAGLQEVFDAYRIEQLPPTKIMYLMALYQLELWIETFLEREEPWKAP